MKISTSLLKTLAPSRNRRHISTNEQSVSAIAYSIVKEKKLHFLNSFLTSKSSKSSHLKSQVEHHEGELAALFDRRTQLSNELLFEEKQWKEKLTEAQKNKDAAASNYFYNLLDLKLKVSHAEKTIQELISASKSSGIPFSISFLKEPFQKVEEQKIVLKDLEAALRNATDELTSTQQKPNELRALVSQFQFARDNYRAAVAKYHVAKANYDKLSKDSSQVKQMIEYVTNAKQQGFSQIASFQFWVNVAKMLAISNRHK